MLQLTIFVEGPADENMVRVLLRAMNVENKAQIAVHALRFVEIGDSHFA